MYETEIVKLFGIMLLVKPLDPLLPTRTKVSIFFFRDSCVSEIFKFFLFLIRITTFVISVLSKSSCINLIIISSNYLDQLL